MRILKRKIALANSLANQKALSTPRALRSRKNSNNSLSTEVVSSPESSKRIRERIPGCSFTPEHARATKNIVKNYGRAICSFAVSNISAPYLGEILEKEGVLFQSFADYVNEIKEKIDGLQHFRSVLLMKETDDERMLAMKRCFVQISEVFIKKFSVNWIYHSKVFHKEAHLKFRFKMLRRIQCPELFTYLKDPRRQVKYY